MGNWYKSSYRRNLIDMHIEEWDDNFLSKLDPKQYVNLLKKAHVQSAMVYSQSHAGYCYWPTNHGKMHKGLKGRDFLGEVIGLCHRESMDVIVYYSILYDTWAYEQGKDWRAINRNGLGTREWSTAELFGVRGNELLRYGKCCPNSRKYKEYALKQVEDLCTRYDFEGMYFDMVFWPVVCYCEGCKERYAAEVGGDIPREIDWNNQDWVTFQNKREEWISGFAQEITETVKRIKPLISVEHQCAQTLKYWRHGLTDDFVKACDFVGGDLYGGIKEQSFVCKFYHSITPNKPFEYMTSRGDPNLIFHTTTKPKELLELHTYVAMAHQGAFLFIDAINPDGTICPKTYEIMGEVFGKSKEYEPYLGGKMCADVAVYFSMSCKFDINDKTESKNFDDYPHIKAALGASETLRQSHIPFAVISKNNLNELSDYQIVIIPNACRLSEEEALKFTDFAKRGGSLYISGQAAHPLLYEVLGIKEVIGITREHFTYMSPVTKDKCLMLDIDEDAPLTITGAQLRVKAVNEADVIARITLPYTDPDDGSIFASIHSNPPGITTEDPAIILRKYGEGKVVWTAAPIETEAAKMSRKVFLKIIKSLSSSSFIFMSDAPAVVEFVLFHQPEMKRYILNVVNEQEQLPPVTAHNIEFTVCLGDKKPNRLTLLPDKKELTFMTQQDAENGYSIKAYVPELYIFQMLALDYEECRT